MPLGLEGIEINKYIVIFTVLAVARGSYAQKGN